ncbi:hypothetical protein M2387_000974 [Klebsiella sp. BIGb0407]|nr:hypothetical protein [Klebsiella sp. BIGb0407]
MAGNKFIAKGVPSLDSQTDCACLSPGEET